MASRPEEPNDLQPDRLSLAVGSVTGNSLTTPTMGSEELLPKKQRARVMSTFRLQIVLTLFVSVLIIGLSALMFGLVTRIFDRVTPGIESSLRWKAQRGAAELASVSELGLVVSDAKVILDAAADYTKDDDVLGLVALNADGKVVASHGPALDSTKLFQGPKQRVASQDGYFVAWDEAIIEGTTVGRIAVAVSKDRLKADRELKEQMLWAAAIGCGSALVACLLFAAAYLTPLVRVTRQAFHRLEKTTVQALEATRLKSEFLANVSHELRTPMNGIIATSELLISGADNDKQRHYGQIILRSGRALLELLNDILDFSKVEAGKLELRVEPCSVEELLDECRELLLPRAQEKNLNLDVQLDSRVPAWIMVDRQRLRQVLMNLLGNAIKFTESGSVTIRCLKGDEQLAFEVTDTGIGIDARDQERLFEVFSQVDGSYTRKQGGTGLGLAICKRLVDIMGGTIGVRSSPGQGSTFWFRIPLEPAEAPTPSAMPVHRATLLSDAPRSRPRVLLVEDNEINQEVMLELLSQLGLTVEVTSDGQQAVEAAKDRSYSAILMDCQMPVMDGYRATREIRETLGNHKVPIIAVTAHAIVGEREKALAAGMDDYLSKPVTRDEVRTVLDRWINRAGGAIEQESQPMQDSEAEHATGREANDVVGAEQPVLDPQVMRSNKVMRLFLKHVPEQVAGIAEAVEAGDSGALKDRAHKLKGSSNAVGARGMGELCRRLEAYPAEAAELVAELQQQYLRVEREMRGLLHDESGASAP